jgi:uncharacterized phage protein (TIGR02216 family)
MTREKFPWSQLMHLGLGLLRLSPHEFWRSTLRELSAAADHAMIPPLLRQNLDQLMNEYPDGTSE